jgi:hypothetical protein
MGEERVAHLDFANCRALVQMSWMLVMSLRLWTCVIRQEP